MSWTYFLNRMGPMRSNLLGYAAGRVDGDCDDEDDKDYNRYGQEVSVPLMNEDDWYELSDWVDKLRTEHWVGEKIFAMYEKATGKKIRWRDVED